MQFSSSQGILDHFKAITACYSPCTLWNMIYFTSSFPENFRAFYPNSGKSILKLHCNFHNMETPIVLTTLWKISGAFHRVETIIVSSTKLSYFLSVTIHIFNHLEHFCHISSIELADLRGLPLAQYSISACWCQNQSVIVTPRAIAVSDKDRPILTYLIRAHFGRGGGR